MLRLIISMLVAVFGRPDMHLKLSSTGSLPFFQEYRPTPEFSPEQSVIHISADPQTKLKDRQTKRLSRKEMRAKYKSLKNASREKKELPREVLLGIWMWFVVALILGLAALAVIFAIKLFSMGLGWVGLIALGGGLLFLWRLFGMLMPV